MKATTAVAPAGPYLVTLSLGWGVQSFTLAVMSALGDLPPLHAAVHADTTHERSATYAFARRWTPWLVARGVPVVTVADAARSAQVTRDVPAFTVVKGGRGGQLHRQCTGHWKIDPRKRWLSRELEVRGMKKRAGAVQDWLGISWDESHRMKESGVRYIANVWPLVERRMTRADCVDYLTRRGLEVPPKSSCVFCPYQRLDSWKAMKAEAGPDWQTAVFFDDAIRHAPRLKEPPFEIYMHPARKPLDQAVASDDPQDAPGPEDECSGHCMV